MARRVLSLARNNNELARVLRTNHFGVDLLEPVCACDERAREMTRPSQMPRFYLHFPEKRKISKFTHILWATLIIIESSVVSSAMILSNVSDYAKIVQECKQLV